MRHASVNPEETLLDSLQMHALRYLLDETDPRIGLVADSAMCGTVCSIAAVGMALASYPLAVEHGLITRSEVAARTLRLLRRMDNSLQSESVDATGYRGFFYHFLRRPHSRKLDVLATNTVAATPPPGSVDLRSEVKALASRQDHFDASRGQRDAIQRVRPAR